MTAQALPWLIGAGWLSIWVAVLICGVVVVARRERRRREDEQAARVRRVMDHYAQSPMRLDPSPQEGNAQRVLADRLRELADRWETSAGCCWNVPPTDNPDRTPDYYRGAAVVAASCAYEIRELLATEIPEESSCSSEQS